MIRFATAIGWIAYLGIVLTLIAFFWITDSPPPHLLNEDKYNATSIVVRILLTFTTLGIGAAFALELLKSEDKAPVQRDV